MPACDQVKLLLGPFDDGELEPHEMEDVALHVVTCGACKTALDDYRAIGVALRDCFPEPSLDGFSAAVLDRISRFPRPFWIRWKAFFGSIGEHAGTGASLVAAGAFAALLTAWLVTPYAHRLLHRSPNPVSVVSDEAANDRPAAPFEQASNTNESAAPNQPESPMITLSNDPGTTVIWLPNQR